MKANNLIDIINSKVNMWHIRFTYAAQSKNMKIPGDMFSSCKENEQVTQATN